MYTSYMSETYINVIDILGEMNGRKKTMSYNLWDYSLSTVQKYTHAKKLKSEFFHLWLRKLVVNTRPAC